MHQAYKKQMTQVVKAHGLCSGRRVCCILRLVSTTLWYHAGQRSDCQLQFVARLQVLSEAHLPCRQHTRSNLYENNHNSHGKFPFSEFIARHYLGQIQIFVLF